MTDSCVIARSTPVGWVGVYVHNQHDLGAKLHGGLDPAGSMLATEFGGEVEKMARSIVDEHPAGYSYVDDIDLAGACYCHDEDDPREPAMLVYDEDRPIDSVDAFFTQLVYVIRPDGIQVLNSHDTGRVMQLENVKNESYEVPVYERHHVALIPWGKPFDWSFLEKPAPVSVGAKHIYRQGPPDNPMSDDEALLLNELLDKASNMIGELSASVRERLYFAVEVPCAETWDDAYSIVLNVSSYMTLWQAVLAVAPAAVSRSKPTEDAWGRTPSRSELLTAIGYAVRS